ncbi:hypothetical protein [Streptomyces sp. NPDC095602]|uniref:hypothetical protein n=1 Tax=unclassified Streptomyces TaxID=2593676 RepID=UPI00331A9270
MPQQQPESRQPSEVSMRDLLASCAAANAVSTPPRPAAPGPATPQAETSGPDRDEDGQSGREGRDSETPRAA